jgi:hypothetical protein
MPRPKKHPILTTKCHKCGGELLRMNLVRFKKLLWCKNCLNPDYEPEIPTWNKSSIAEAQK